jgi:hypothetical protein
VLIYIYRKGVTNPKDKVFALYGLFQALDMAILELDYSKLVGEIYQEVTQAAILHDKSSNILDYIALFGVAPDAPSWVPNWNGGGIEIVFSKPFCVAKDSSPYYHFSPNGSQLTLSGIHVDEISTRGDLVLFLRGPKAAINGCLNIAETIKSIQNWH